MKYFKIPSFLFLCVVGLLGCNEKETKVYDVQFLVDNSEMRKSILTECKAKIHSPSDANSVMKEPNCKNADEAQKIYTTKFNSTGGKERMKTHVVIGENK